MGNSVLRRVTPDPDSVTLADHMLSAADVNQDILEETVDSAVEGRIHESGRTACGSANTIHQPVTRMPTAVELSTCPVGHLTGFWHTHVTRDQFMNPEHSLPDVANVLLEGAGASIVTGLETSHVLHAAEEPEEAAEAFRDVLGLDVYSTPEVKDAIVDGRVPDPPGARRRVFGELSALFDRRQTPLVDPETIEAGLTAIPPTMSAPGEASISYELIECALNVDQTVVDDPLQRIRDNARTGSQALRYLSKRMATEGFDEAVGVVAGTIVSRWLFG